MQYNFAVDPVTKQQIAIFRCFTANGFPKNEFVLAKYHHGWEYYQGNNTWLCYHGWKTAFVFDTKEEAELVCLQYFDFLKECGYDFCS